MTPFLGRSESIVGIVMVLIVATSVTLAAQAPAEKKQAPAPKQPLDGTLPKGQKLPGDLSDLLDADGDGKISDVGAAKAVAQFQKAANGKGDEAQAIRKALDFNGDGKIDAKEAATAVARLRIEAGGNSQAVAVVFDSLDEDRNEVVTPAEFQSLIKKLGPLLGPLLAPKLGQMFNQMDANRDGLISLIESQLAADSFAEQAAIKRQQEEKQRNAEVWQRAQQLLTALDRNRDQRVSPREAESNPNVKAKFAQIDVNLNGKLTLAELYEFLGR